MGFEEEQSKMLLEKFHTVQAALTSSEAKGKRGCSTTSVHTEAALFYSERDAALTMHTARQRKYKDFPKASDSTLMLDKICHLQQTTLMN